ncbi:MAG: kinase [Candidatus Omnitrophica bacterium]|nr:kinase [Candidatus Omnitrophota bacterium]
MIISRTPYRISFLGGGTDYPVWYKENGGRVLATTINKYCYITCRYLPPFFEHKSRIVYSRMELVKRISEIQHPAVRECLRFLKITRGIEIHHDGDLPARAGLGSSSAFTVGLLHVLYSLKGTIVTKRRLALDAIFLEQKVMNEQVGSQDQVLAAFGGFNLIEFGGTEQIKVCPVTLSQQRMDSFQENLMLFFTGFSRYASDIAAEQIKETKNKKRELRTMHQLVDRGVGILSGNKDLADFGRLLHENWKLKRSLSSKISTPALDDIYDTARRAGASGGKILGAGGGGFMLIFARKEAQPKIREKLKKLLYVPFRFENLGSQIIFYTA